VKQSQLYSVIEPVRDRFRELGNDEQRDFHRKMMKYVRTYSFLSQILPFDDAALEKFYAFSKYVLRFISLKKETLPREVTQEVDMDSYRIQRMFEGKIDLDRGKGEINPNKLDGGGQQGEKKESLSEIIRILNDRYGTNFTDADKVFHNFRERLYNDDAVQKSYKVNTQENAQLTFKDKANEHAKAMIDEHFDFFKKYNDDDDFREALTHMFFNDFKSWMAEQAGN
jgi:type I restriction enzyme R subunit